MTKTILITGSTDGIGLETAKLLVAQGNLVLVHGRNPEKLEAVSAELSGIAGNGRAETYQADFSHLENVAQFASDILERHDRLDVLINNAGILKSADPVTPDGLDVRFAVNAVAPYLLTVRLMPVLDENGRVINLSSAAQTPVDMEALSGRRRLDDMAAYAQSKLALTMWSRHMAKCHPEGPAIIAVNPGSLLASKMVKQGFGVAGNDLGIGASILVRAALGAEFADASGCYFDNDSGQFAAPHADALDPERCAEIGRQIEAILSSHLPNPTDGRMAV